MPFVAIYDNYLNFVDFNNFTANSYKKVERMVHDPSLISVYSSTGIMDKHFF